MDSRFYSVIEESPIIVAVKNKEGLERCLKTDSKVVFILFGDICNIHDIVQKVKDAGKMAMVHIDLILGLNSKEISVDYIKMNTQADGIISTKINIVNRAKALSMYTVFRLFIIDSMALSSLENQNSIIKADLIEILPGVMPRVIKKVCQMTSKPVIAGGLISEKAEVVEALEAGAISVSTTNENVWFM
ncbi:MAG: glycerol-3-phosphate responsive antiterminator [Lachnotalea sp.]